MLFKYTIISILASMSSALLAQSVEVRKNANNDPRIELLNPDENTFLGLGVGIANTGIQNTAVGNRALFSNTLGELNTATGYRALYFNTEGYSNVANGASALRFNTTGFKNTAIGASALYNNTEGYLNTANGESALYYNTTGFINTAIGANALQFNITGTYNTANGVGALFINTEGNYNTANGSSALRSNTMGNSNTATGLDALFFNTIGHANSALGVNALYHNTTGSQNTAIGALSLEANTIGNINTAVGFNANVGTGALSNAIAIGANAQVNCSNCMVLGSVFGVNDAPASVKVGIGITSPIASLDVAGTGGYGTAAFRGTTNISHFNFGEDEDTYIRAGKDNGVVVLNDIPGGTVGIGTIDAGFPLSFAPLLGDKISLFGNSGSHYGLGIQSYLMQIYTDAVGADIAFGYGSSSSFTERMRIINSGELGMKVNGRIELKNGTIPLNNNYGPGIWLYNSDNSGVLGFMGTQNNQNLGFFGGPDGWGLTYDAINSRVGIRTSTPSASLEVNGYTKLGSDSPSIKVKKLTGTTNATEGNYVNIASGVTSSKILSVSVMVSYDTDIWIGPYHGVAGYNFRWVVALNGSISVENYFGDSANILSKPIKILITYEE